MMKKILFGGLAMALAATAAAETAAEKQQRPQERQRRMKKETGDDQGSPNGSPQKHSTGRTAAGSHQEPKKENTKRASHQGGDYTIAYSYHNEDKKKSGNTKRHHPEENHDDDFDYQAGGRGKGSKKGGYDDDDDHYSGTLIPTYHEDDAPVYYDDHFADDYLYDDQYIDDYYYGGKGSSKGGGSGYYDDYYYDDYYYNGKGKGKGGKKSSKSSKKSSKKGGKGKGGYYDDDVFIDDIFIDDIFIDDIFGDDFFNPGVPARPTIPLTGTVASEPALLSVVPDTSNPDPFAVGTVYPFGNTTYNPSTTTPFIDLVLDGVNVEFEIRLDGYCTRTGTPDNTVEAYCHFTYTVIDPAIAVNAGGFVAEGPLSNPQFLPCSPLHVTGGTGIFTAASGLVGVCPSILDGIGMIESLPEGEDLFEDVDAYLHLIDMSLDEQFVFTAA